jgi:hypothetical protein
MVSEVLLHGHMALLLLSLCVMRLNIIAESYDEQNKMTHILSEKRQRDGERRGQGQDIPFQGMLPVTYFLQLGSTS